ncbi:MAG: DNA-3-methyladenine glycosylase [Planctomycetota bacterium]|nr:DNA-3-methyladenine glycosylase [Planctomycetota bacterium]
MVDSRLARSFFNRAPTLVARELLGKVLIVDGIGGLITETEAYDGANDPAAHTYRGETQRNRSMFQRAGTLYVYRIHRSFCMNTVARRKGQGAGVLIRGIAPRIGLEVIKSRRGGRPKRSWCDGPGKLTQALGISLEDDGTDLLSKKSRVRLLDSKLDISEDLIEVTPRIGISKAKDFPWRFVLPKAPPWP